MTQDGAGLLAVELPDGKNLVYQANPTASRLVIRPVSGGAPRELIGCVKAFDVTAAGVFYVACGPQPVLHVQDPATGRDRVLGPLPQFQSDPGPVAFSVSPDGATVLYVGLGAANGDLMLIENFK